MKILKLTIAILIVTCAVSTLTVGANKTQCQKKSKIVKKTIPNRTIVLSFDDAVSSLFSVAKPMLDQYGYKGTFFICEFPPNFNDKSKYMSWEQMAQLDKEGHELGNHTQTHPLITKISQDKLKKEVGYIAAKFQEYGIKPTRSFAYPAYSNDSASISILQTMGYTRARTGSDRYYNPLQDNPMQIPSVTISSTNKDNIIKFIRNIPQGQIAVITFHGIPDYEHPWVTISKEDFAEILEVVDQQKCNVVTMRDLEKYINIEKAAQLPLNRENP